MSTDWRMKGQYLKNCSCAPGCPCDFWARPTYGNCHGCNGMKIAQGHFGQVPLDGLVWAVIYSWPGALHEGNGTVQAFIDQRADDAQRNALLSILSGKFGGPWFEVVSSLVSNFLPPRFAPITFEFDLPSRSGKIAVDGEFQSITGPIVDAMGNEYHVNIGLPRGIEYFTTEVAVAKVLTSTGAISFAETGCHSSLSEVEHTPAGLR